jgi:lantibiotic modifying enzyme
MGFALFERYYQRHFNLPEATRTWERVESSLAAIGNENLMHSFAGGISGMAWAFLHLYKEGLLSDGELDAQCLVEDLDEPLFESAMTHLKGGDYDYLHGGLSSILYFIERDPSPKIEQYVTTLISQLESIAVRAPQGGLTWKLVDSERGPEAPVLYSLGLSHGTSSIVSTLSLLYQKGYAQKQCARLIAQTLRWMWNVRNQNNIALFPSTVSETPCDQYSRMAWCYGDLGVATSFYLAGNALGVTRWKDRARYILRKGATRRDFSHTKVRDSGICHGSAGIGYIYQKFAVIFRSPLLQATAQYWLQDMLQRTLPAPEENVFLQFDPINQENHPSLGLLGGEAGIGLVLLSALGAPTRWDRFLLLG